MNENLTLDEGYEEQNHLFLNKSNNCFFLFEVKLNIDNVVFVNVSAAA